MASRNIAQQRERGRWIRTFLPDVLVFHLQMFGESIECSLKWYNPLCPLMIVLHRSASCADQPSLLPASTPLAVAPLCIHCCAGMGDLQMLLGCSSSSVQAAWPVAGICSPSTPGGHRSPTFVVKETTWPGALDSPKNYKMQGTKQQQPLCSAQVE